MRNIFSTIILILAAACFAPAYAQTLQTVRGKVVDETSKAPLAGVIVVQADSAAAANGTATDSAGNFELKMPIGRHTLSFTFVGYEGRAANDVIVTAGKEVVLNIGMQEAIRGLQEVTVVHRRAKDKTATNNEMALVSARSFNVDETKRYAGSLGDPSRMAANFAGVASGNDATNDIVVRGNSPSGMLWQVEGMNIPNPNHYGSLGSTGGPISMINNNNIDKSDFLTSAFPAQYGNALAGVFDIKLRDGNKQKNEFMAQMGFNGFELGAEGPLGRNKKTSYLFNYRYSTLGVFQKLGINFGTGSATPLYQDLNFKVVSDISKTDKLILFGISGTSSIEFLGREIDTTKVELYGGDPYANQRNKYLTTMTGLSWEKRLSPKTFSKLTVGYSTTMEHFKEDSISYIENKEVPRYDHKFTTGKMSAIYSIAHKFSAKDRLEAGATYDVTMSNLYDKETSPTGEKTNIDSKNQLGLLQGYAQWKHRFTNSLSMTSGIHAQYLDVNNAVAAEPRLSVRCNISPKQMISAGYGVHHQMQTLPMYFLPTSTPAGIIYTNKSLDFTRSNHFVLTYDWNISNNMRLKAETYYQMVDRVPVEQRSSAFSLLNTGANFGNNYADSLVNKGSGRNYGVELTLERFYKKGFYFLITSSLFQSKYQGSDGIERNTAFNTGYVANVLGGKEFKLGGKGNTLALNLKFTAVGGRYLTPIDLDLSRATGNPVYLEDKAFSEQQPAYLRADVKLAYKKEYRKSTLEIALDMQNITNHQNVFSQYYDSKAGKIVTVYQQSFFPVPMVRYTF